MRLLFVCALFLNRLVFAQPQTATMNGTVTDETGAFVPKASINVTGPIPARTVVADQNGKYTITGLPPGSYTVEASAPQLSQTPVKINLKPGTQTLNLQLKVSETVQHITVQESTGPTLSVEPSANASALVLKGADLDALPDDPEDLAADLQALAGPSAGPSGGQIFIDGFSGGELPPKDAIREIRINQNPFSPEYDKLGYGRIEIFTKPGTDKLHGSVYYNFGNSFWNSRNPYSAEKPPFDLNEVGANLSGPLGKRISFFLTFHRDMVTNGSVTNGVVLDPTTFAQQPFSGFTETPQERFTINPRLDFQLNQTNTLTLRYSVTDVDVQNSGIGIFDLGSRGYQVLDLNQTLQATETATLGAAVNETRFQYFRSAMQQVANENAPEISVLDSFNSGGANVGHTFDTENYYEFQNYTTRAKGNHTWKWGLRLRAETDDNISPENFNGTFTFTGGPAPELNSSYQPVIGSDGQPVMIQETSIERYQRTLIFQQMGLSVTQMQALGGGPSQFSINAGNPQLKVSQVDAGAFIGDDWRVRQNLTISIGLRYEIQTNIHDRRDFAPRFGFAWAPRSAGRTHPKLVLRGGFGIFYDRFPLTDTITALRYNGVNQQQYVITNPDFYPNIPPISALAEFQSTQVIEEKDADLRAPYLMQSAFTAERQLARSTTLALTYTNTHGLHQLRSYDINQPLPGTFNPSVAGSGVYPYGTVDPIFLMTSSGLYNQNQFITNINSRLNQNVSLFGFYVLNYAMSNTDGLSTFPANEYNWSGEYGPAATDIRNRFFLGGSINTRWNVRLSPFVMLQSGAPFNITTGNDLYGTTMFNARPSFAASPGEPGVIDTPYGYLNPNPLPSETIVPRNYGRGPGQYSVNIRLSKTWGFGPERKGPASSGGGGRGGGGGGGGRGGGIPAGAGAPPGGPGGLFGGNPTTSQRYNFTLSMSARNILNHNNPGPITGNITSPLFGQANSMAAGGGGFGATGGPGGLPGVSFAETANERRLELQLRFSF